MVELEVNGIPIEQQLGANEITYTKQAADLFDIGSIANSYSNSISFPKTPANTQALQGLGLVGNQSTAPFDTNQARLRDDGDYIVPYGNLSVKEVGDDYKGSVISGVIDFLKAIENRTMGGDVNLSDFSHEKNIETVTDSFTNEYYTYIIADYNGKKLTQRLLGIELVTAINIDYLVPCFNMGKLLRAVFDSFGFGYDFTEMDKLDTLYITYPKAPNEATSEELAADLYKNPYVTTEKASYLGELMYSPSKQPWDVVTVTSGSMSGDLYVVPSTGIYRIDYDVQAYAIYKIPPLNNNFIEPAIFRIEINGNQYSMLNTDPLNPITGSISLFLSAGDTIRKILVAYKNIQDHKQLYSFNTNGQSVKIYQTNQGNIDLSDAFKDFQVTDFVKECLWYTGCTMLLDPDTQEVSFKTVSQRLDVSLSQDWSDKFVERKRETYADSSFAQKNAFVHKYNDANASYANGYLYIPNSNLAASKTLVNSRIYAPDGITSQFVSADPNIGFSTDTYRIWQSETKESEDGTLEVTYKGLNQRFYYIKKTQSAEGEWYLGSDSVGGSAQVVESLPYAYSPDTTFDKIVPLNYSAYDAVLKNMRIHSIDLAIGSGDFREADLSRPFYFGQEGAYYMMNKLTYKKNGLANAECVKISPDYITPAPVDNTIAFAVRTGDLSLLGFRVGKVDGFGTFVEGSAVIDGTEYTFTDVTDPDGLFVQVRAEGLDGTFHTVESFTLTVSDGTNQRRYDYSGPPFLYGELEADNGMTLTVYATITNL